MGYALEMFTHFTQMLDDEITVLELYFENMNYNGMNA